MKYQALLLLLSLAACDASVDTDGSDLETHQRVAEDSRWIDPNLSEAELCSVDADAILPGDASPGFVAVARDVVEFDPDASVTLRAEDNVVELDNSSIGTIQCRCDSGCSAGSCEIHMGTNDASCSGTCEGMSDGQPCGGCSWHYGTGGGGGGGGGGATTPTMPSSPLPHLPSHNAYPDPLDPSPLPLPTLPAFPKKL